MKHHLVILVILLQLCACEGGQKKSSSAAPSAAPNSSATSQFSMEAITGTQFQIATRNEQENVAEQGITDNKGVKNGIWVTYQGEQGHPAKVASYVNGQYNGPYFEFDDFGRMALRATYKNNKLHGQVSKFLNGSLVQESHYLEGVLDGVYKEYNRNGLLQKEINYKNGKLDGAFRYYDSNGKVSLQYTYKNGKQQ